MRSRPAHSSQGYPGGELRRDAILTRRMVEHAPVGLALVAGDGRFVRVNEALCELSGRSRDELLQLVLEDLAEPDVARHADECRAALLSGDVGRYHGEHRIFRRDGSALWVAVSMELLPPDSVEVAPLVVVVTDISERLALEEKLRRLSERDPLTGLHNRRFFMGEIDRRLAEIRRHGGTATAVVIDLDDFKAINDTHGHAAGDAVLCAVATRLRARVRDSDLLARTGGDEFAVLLSASDERDAQVFIDDALRATSELEVSFAQRHITVSVSVGLARLDPRDVTQTAEALLRCADLAMYATKDHRRTAPSSRTRRARGQTVVGAPRERWLRQGLRTGSLEACCAPVVDLADGRVSHHELLVAGPGEGGPLSPSELTSQANDAVLAGAVDRWAIERAVAMLAGATDAPAPRRLGVDISVISLHDQTLAGFVERILDGTSVAADAIVFEVTGLGAVGDRGCRELPPAIRALDELGCGLALDHFGAGAESLSILECMPMRYLKLDPQYFGGPTLSGWDRLIVQTAAAAARELGVRSVATGIRDDAALGLARELGLDMAQGPHVPPGRAGRAVLPPQA